MDYDIEKVDQATLALLYLTLHDSGSHGGRAWKGHDWDVLDRLHKKGLIDNPASKAKSLFLNADGLAAAKAAFEELFTKSK